MKTDDVFRQKGHRRVGRKILLLLLIVVMGAGLYTAFDNGRAVVRTQRVLVADLPEVLEGFAVLHISDLGGARFGPKQKQIQSLLKGVKYSAVCITGDMLGPSGDPTPLYELLAALDPTKPVYFIAGDNDPKPISGQSAGYYTVLADWVQGAHSRGAKLLNAPKSQKVGTATVWFSDADAIGVDVEAAQQSYALLSSSEGKYYAESYQEAVIARKAMKAQDLHIALTHRPLTTAMAEQVWDDGYARSVDLVLAGSTAGGQWMLPIVGPVWANGIWFPGANTVGGYHYAAGFVQSISRGLGVDKTSPLPAIRLFNTPEMTLIVFTSRMGEDVLPTRE